MFKENYVYDDDVVVVDHDDHNNNGGKHHNPLTSSTTSSCWLMLSRQQQHRQQQKNDIITTIKKANTIRTKSNINNNHRKHKRIMTTTTTTTKMKSNLMMKYFIWIRAWSSSSPSSSTIMASRWQKQQQQNYDPIWSYGCCCKKMSMLLMVLLGLLMSTSCNAQQQQQQHQQDPQMSYPRPPPLQPQHFPPGLLPHLPHLQHPQQQQQPSQSSYPFLFAQFIPNGPTPTLPDQVRPPQLAAYPLMMAPQQPAVPASPIPAPPQLRAPGVGVPGLPPGLPYHQFNPHFLLESSSIPRGAYTQDDDANNENAEESGEESSPLPTSSTNNISANQTLNPEIINVKDGRDPKQQQPKCSANEFQCLENALCIDWSNVGDGVPDCPDASDECPDPLTQFRCKCGRILCVQRSQVMDGQINCEDGSDEGLDHNIGCNGFSNNELMPVQPTTASTDDTNLNNNGFMPLNRHQISPPVSMIVIPNGGVQNIDPNSNNNPNDRTIPMVMMVTDEDLRLMAQAQNQPNTNDNPNNFNRNSPDNHYTAEDTILLLPENMSADDLVETTASGETETEEVDPSSKMMQQQQPPSQAQPSLSPSSSPSSSSSDDLVPSPPSLPMIVESTLNGEPISMILIPESALAEAVENSEDEATSSSDQSLSPTPSTTSKSTTSSSLMEEDQMKADASSSIPMSFTLISPLETTSSTSAKTSNTPTSSSSSTLDVVEYTGTFLPYDLLTAPSKYPYYQRLQHQDNTQSDDHLTDSKSFVEITGTFIPQMITIREPTDDNQDSEMSPTKTQIKEKTDNTATVTMMTRMTGSNEDTSSNVNGNSEKDKSENNNKIIDMPSTTITPPPKLLPRKIYRQATNQTFIIGNRRLIILTGIISTPKNVTNNNTTTTNNDDDNRQSSSSPSSKMDEDQNEDNQAFIVACAENRINKSPSSSSTSVSACDYVPIKIQSKDFRSNSENFGEVLSVYLASTGKYLIVTRSLTSQRAPRSPGKSFLDLEKDDEKIMMHAEIELNSNNDPMDKNIIYSGLGFKNIKKIEVNPDRKYVPISVKDLQPSIVDIRLNSSKPIMVPIIVQNDPPKTSSSIFQIPSSSTSQSSSSSNVFSLSPTSTRTFSLSTPAFNLMQTHTVGHNNRFHRNHQQKLGSFFSGGPIPQYDPTLAPEPEKPISSTLSLFKPETSTEAPIKATSTIFGFIDFTTIVNGTLLIFTPKSKAEVERPAESSLTKIEPTKVASIPMFTMQTSSAYSISSPEEQPPPLFNGRQASPTTTEIKPESSKDGDVLSESVSSQIELSSSSPQSKSPDYNEYLITTTTPNNEDDLTITNGFILPSFTSIPTSSTNIVPSSSSILSPSSELEQDLVSFTSIPIQPSSPTQRLIATTFTTKHTEYITEEVDGELITRSSEVITTNVVYNPAPTGQQKVKPTKPMRTFYTTYTYYTTFKNTETEFVHSRKEIVTNIVDPDELKPSTSIQKTLNPVSIIKPTSVSDILRLPKSTTTSSTTTTTTTTTTPVTPMMSSVTINPHQQQPTPSLESKLSELNSDPSPTTTTTPIPPKSNKQLNKSYLGKLLSGIAVPITHYTTFTYYTTFFKDSTSQIVSRTNVISNIVTGTINLNHAAAPATLQKRSSGFMTRDPVELSPAAAENLPILITPVTEYSTSTLYTTFFVPGQGSTVVTNTHVFSNIYLPEAEDLGLSNQRQRPVITTTRASIDNYPFLTTINYPTIQPSPTTVLDRLTETAATASGATRLINGIPVFDDNIILNPNDLNLKQSTVVPYRPQSQRQPSSLARIEMEGVFDDDDRRPPQPPQQSFSGGSGGGNGERQNRRKVVKITKTRRIGDGLDATRFPDGSVRKSTVFINGPPQQQHHQPSPPQQVRPPITGSVVGDLDGHYHDVNRAGEQEGRLHPTVTPTPVTYYTTYTYFTTALVDGTPVVRSNEHLFSTVITGKILPTRVVPDSGRGGRRIKRTTMAPTEQPVEDDNQIDQNGHQNNDDVDGGHQQQSKKSEQSRTIGVVSEVTNEIGDKTLVTQIIGTMINGFYAQFAITKTLDPPPVLIPMTVVSFVPSTTSATATSMLTTNHLERETETESKEDDDDEEIDEESLPTTTESANEIDYSTEMSNNIEDNNGNGNIGGDSSKELDTTTTENPPTTTTTTSVENPDSEMMIDDSWMSIEDHAPSTATNSSVSVSSSSKTESSLMARSIDQTFHLTSSIQSMEPVYSFSTPTLSLTSSNLNQMDLSSQAMPVFPGPSSSETPSPSITTTEESPVTPTIDYRTGLIQSTVETITDLGQGHIIRLTKEIFGTYIGGIYAHLAKTRSETITATKSLNDIVDVTNTKNINARETILSTDSDSGSGTDFMPVFITTTTTSTITTTTTSTCTVCTTSSISSPHELSILLSDNSSPSIADSVSAPTASFTILSSSVAADDSNADANDDDVINTTPTLNNTEPILETPELDVTPTTTTSSGSVDQQSLWPSLPGLSSISYSTGTINDSLVVIYTTEYYTTQINGFTAHYSRDTSNIIGTIEPTSTISTKPSIHFPTPVRFLFSSRYQQTPPITTITVTTTLPSEDAFNGGGGSGLMIQSESSLLAARKYKPIYSGNNNNNGETNFDDEPSYIVSSSQPGQMPRSRTIREKDTNAQPFVDYDSNGSYDGDVDYADQMDQPPPSPPTTTTTTTPPPSRGRQSYLSHHRSRGGGSGGGAGFGQRVPFGARGAAYDDWQRNPSPSVNNNRGILPRRRQPQHQQPMPQQQSPQARSSNSNQNSRNFMEQMDPQQQPAPSSPPSRGGLMMEDNTMQSIPNGRSNGRPSSLATNRLRNRGGAGRGRLHHYSTSQTPAPSTTTTTTTTAPLPTRNINLLPSQRLRLNRKYSRNRLPHLHHQQPQPKPQQPSPIIHHRSPLSDSDQTRRFGRHGSHSLHHRGRPPIQLQSSMQQPTMYPTQITSTVYATETIPKLPITVTSIATVVKTVPIFHGYRTSYATLTTTTLNTSVIGHSMYETMVNEDGMTRTLYTRMTDQIEPNKVTEVLVTTSMLQEVKLVPIKFGYSTRTETLTDIKTFTMLTTVVATNSNPNGLLLFSQLLPSIPLPQLSTTTTTYVTTQTLSSTTSVSLLLHGKTLVSTLTFTSTTESTVTKTITLEPTVPPQAYHHIQPTPLVTMLTLSIRGENGEIIELVTAITVPIQIPTTATIVATKVERDIRPTNSGGSGSGSMILDLDDPDQDQDRLYDDDVEDSVDYGASSGGHVMLESSSSGVIGGIGSGHNTHNRHNNNRLNANHHQNNNHQQFISASFKTVDTQLISQESNTHPYFITTIFKGPNTEIYEANALLVDNNDNNSNNGSSGNHQNQPDEESRSSNNVFRKRKLLQYSDNLYKEPSAQGLVDNRFTPERTKPNGNKKFQRIRIKQSKPLNNPQQQQQQQSSSPANDFHRLVGLDQNSNTSPASPSPTSQTFGPEAFNSFRRQPLQGPADQPPPFNLYSSVAVSIPPITSTASYLLANNFQKPTYRKIKPNGSRRLVSSIRTVNPTVPGGGIPVPIQPSHVLSSRLMIPSTTAFLEVPNHFNLYPRLPQSPPAGPPPDFIGSQRLIQHTNRAILPHHQQQSSRIRTHPSVNHFNVPPANVLDDLSSHPHQHHPNHHPHQNIGPPMMIYETAPNYPAPNAQNEFVDVPNNDLLLGSIRYSELYRPTSSSSHYPTPELESPTLSPTSSSSSSSSSAIHTPTIPLTYYTTFTYLTTVIRGQHTAHLSRESVTSAITTRALDKSIVEIVRDSDGVIEPTRLQELGTKTKGLATTVYNALYQVQIYNEDLYKVIQKTYNKEVSFKPWQQPTTTAYKPVFVTNNVDEPSSLGGVVNDPVTPTNEFDFIRTASTTPTYENAMLHTPHLVVTPSLMEPSYQQPVVNTAEPTPTIDQSMYESASSPSSSIVATTRPVRISSSVVRKPYNPRYTHPMSRSRLRMRVSSRTSNLVPISEATTTTTTNTNDIATSTYGPINDFESSSPSSSLFVPISSPAPTPTIVVEPSPTITTELPSSSSASPSTNPSFTRPNLFRSKVIFRQRPGQTAQPMNSKIMRISSRLVRPGGVVSSSTSSTQHQPTELFSPTAVLPSPTWETSSSFTPMEPQQVDKVDHSDVGRANKFVRVSNGVTLIISSKVATPTRPMTLEPTLVTGAAVMMKNIIPGDYNGQPELEASIREPSSSTPAVAEDPSASIQPSLTTETLEFYRTSTLLSTMTYYATLFNGSASSITPIEDVKTEFITYPDTTVITRTVEPTNAYQDQTIATTTSAIKFHPTNYLTSVPKLTTSSTASLNIPMITSLKSTYTTLTHYITLFHGSHTILSSIEEISPTVVTETIGQQSTKTTRPSANQHNQLPAIENIRFTQPSDHHHQSMLKPSKNLFGGLVPSVSTLFTTHTYFTTLFSGTTSIIQSREEITHSLITLYVPSSNAGNQIKLSTTELPNGDTTISPSSASDQPFITSTSTTMTYYIPESGEEESEMIAIGGGSILEPSQMSTVTSQQDDSQSMMTTSTLKDTSDAVVYFTNFILPSSVQESENTIDGAKGPLLNHGDLTLVNDQQQRPTIGGHQITPSLPAIAPPTYQQPVQPPLLPSVGEAQSPTLKPGAIIELTDLLDGANLAGNIGEAIKDIVQILAKGQKPQQQPAMTTTKMDQIDRTSVIPHQELLPPKDGATVSHMDDPVYIPINQQHGQSSTGAQEPKQSPTLSLMKTITNVPDLIIGSPAITFVEPSVAFTSATYMVNQEAPTPPVAYVPSASGSSTSPKPSPSFVQPSMMDHHPKSSLSSIRLYSSFTPVFDRESGPRSSIHLSTPTSSSQSPIFSTVPAVVQTMYSNNNYVVVGGTEQPESSSDSSQTKYITSVETTPMTTVMTTTKVYYTRDSPLTITSSYTTTMPLKTVITTIVGGTKTIMNTYSTEIRPTKSTVGHPQTTASVTSIGNNAGGGTRTSGSSGSPFRPTRKPGVNRFKPPVRPTEPPKIFKTSHRPRQPYKPSPTPPPEVEFESGRGGSGTRKATTKFAHPKTTTRPSILDLDQCKPGCNAANKEICREFDGKFKCDCRPGYVKKMGSDVCLELQNFIVLVRVTRLGDQDLEWDTNLQNHTSDLYQNLAKAARSQVDSAYVMINSMKENYIGADVLDIAKAHDGHGVLVNMTIHLTESNNIDEDLIREELSRTLMMPKPGQQGVGGRTAGTNNSGSNPGSGSPDEQLPSPQQIYADLEDVVDFDECSSEEYNDCASSARCINEPGSYRCECLNGYPDLDLSFPGRICASEIKACEFCYGRGDCYRDETGQISSCKCHRMYLGRRCEINGLLLAIFIPVIAILCIITICSIVYCCRKWRNRALVKGFRNFSAYGPNMIGSTLDRKAMLETSSDNSDPMRSHISYEGPGITATDATLSREYRRRRESEHHTTAAMLEPYADPTLAAYPTAAAAANSIPYNFNTQFMIPRVRNASSTNLNNGSGAYTNGGYSNGVERGHHHGGGGSRSHHHSRHQYAGPGSSHNHHHHHHQNSNGNGSSGGSGGSHSHHSHHHHHHSAHHQHHHSSSSNYDYDNHIGGRGGGGGHSHHQYAAW